MELTKSNVSGKFILSMNSLEVSVVGLALGSLSGAYKPTAEQERATEPMAKLVALSIVGKLHSQFEILQDEQHKQDEHEQEQ